MEDDDTLRLMSASVSIKCEKVYQRNLVRLADVSAQLPSSGPGRYPGTTSPTVSSCIASLLPSLLASRVRLRAQNGKPRVDAPRPDEKATVQRSKLRGAP